MQLYDISLFNTIENLYVLLIICCIINTIENILIIKYSSRYVLYDIKTIFVDSLSIFFLVIYFIKIESFMYSFYSVVIRYLSIVKIIIEIISILYNSFRDFKHRLVSSHILPVNNIDIVNIVSKKHTIIKTDECIECNKCAICLDCFYCGEDKDINITICKHLYHYKCLKEFIKYKITGNTYKEIRCILCQQIIYK